MSTLEKILLWVIRAGVLSVIVATPHIVAPNFFFPFITGKNFFFRIVVEIIFASWLALAVINPDFRPRKSPLLFAITAFIGVLSVAAFFGADPFHSFWSNFERMEGLVTHLHVFAFFLAAAHSLKSKTEWFYLFGLSILSSFAAAFHGILQQEGVTKILGSSRPYAGFGNSIYLGVYILFHLFIIPFFIYRVKLVWVRVVLGIIFFVELYAFFIAASRGALIGLGAGALFVAVFVLALAPSLRYRAAGMAVILIFLATGLTVIYMPDSPVVKNVEVLSRFSSVSLENLSRDPRIMIWGIAWDAFKAKPVLGWGPENFIIPYAKYYNPNLYGNEPWFDRAHNMFLEWLVAGGIPALTAYIGIFALVSFLLWKLVRLQELDKYSAVLIGGFFVAYIVQNFFVFDNIVTYIIFFSVLAFLHSLYIGRIKEGGKNMVKYINSPEVKYFVVAAVFAVMLSGGYLLNAKPMRAAGQLINALKSFSTGRAEVIIGEFDKALGYDGFAETEVRERFADIVEQLGRQVKGPNESFLILLDKSIAELEKEAEKQPDVAKYAVFLGRHYAVKYQLITPKDEESLKASIYWYQRALQIAPEYVQTHLGMAETYLISGQPEKAVAEADNAYYKGRYSGTLFYTVLSVHMLAGDADGALEIMLDYVKVSKYKENKTDFQGDSINEVITRSLLVKDLKARARFLEELINWAGSNPYAHAILAQTYGDLGDKTKAVEQAKLAAELDTGMSAEVTKFIQSLEVSQ